MLESHAIDTRSEGRTFGNMVRHRATPHRTAHANVARAAMSVLTDERQNQPLLPQDKTGADPDRVGCPTNHLLSDGGLSTVVAGATNKTNRALASSLQRLHARSGGGSDRSLSTAFRAIGVICDKLGLVRVIKDRAYELYKKVMCRLQATSESSGIEAVELTKAFVLADRTTR